MLARADVQYNNLSTAAWGAADDTINYTYDDNGSVETKITDDGINDTESVVYHYNLQNRLAKVETTSYTGGVPDTDVSVTEYRYNPQGIRIQSYSYDTPDNGTTRSNETVTDYLIDPYNHTGYAQVLQETTDTDVTYYTIGDDVISKSSSVSGVKYLLYDGHGSTRQLVNDTGTIVTGQQYNYDAYGVMLSDSTASGADIASSADTSMLYAGEQWDGNSEMYYNRARYYNPANGLFNRVDPYSGNMQDPQSLHKYAYVHNNPVNAIDPTGKFWGMSAGLSIALVTVSIIFTIQYVAYPVLRWAHRMLITQSARRILADVQRYMESNGWHNVGPDMGPDNALAHAIANIIAVASPVYDGPEEALRIFQMREIGEALHTQMDRANNFAGNQFAVLYLEHGQGNRISYYLRRLVLTWIEDEELVTGVYPKHRQDELKKLDTLFALYYAGQL